MDEQYRELNEWQYRFVMDNPQVHVAFEEKQQEGTAQRSQQPEVTVQETQSDCMVLQSPPEVTQTSNKVSRRKGCFTKEEYRVICSAFLNVSKDGGTGVNQSAGGYYKRFHEYFIEFKPAGSDRTQIAIQHRWGAIQKSVSKFCACKSIVDRRNESGKSEQDRIEDAIRLYEEEQPFTMLHCWKELRQEQNWNDKVQELNNVVNNTGESVPISISQPGESDSAPTAGTTRPEGQDKQKKRRVKGAVDTSSSSTAVEMLQHINETREKKEEMREMQRLKENEQMQEILARKDEKINIQREILEVQKTYIESRAKEREKEYELREREVEARLLTAEAGIMGIDIERVPPTSKRTTLACSVR